MKGKAHTISGKPLSKSTLGELRAEYSSGIAIDAMEGLDDEDKQRLNAIDRDITNRVAKRKRKITKLDAVCRVLCKQDGGFPSERVDYGKGFRWYDYRAEASAILRAIARAERARAVRFEEES
jgi:hypothetical protein